MKLRRLDIDIGESWGEYWLQKEEDSSGDYIKVGDLKEYLYWHVRNRSIHTIYSDLDKELA